MRDGQFDGTAGQFFARRSNPGIVATVDRDVNGILSVRYYNTDQYGRCRGGVGDTIAQQVVVIAAGRLDGPRG